MIPLQFIKPKPLPLFSFSSSGSAASFMPIARESYTFSPMICAISSAESPLPLSSTEISTYASVACAYTLTVPPSGVYLRAFSASVLIINKVNARSAFTIRVVGSISSFCFFISKARRPFPSKSNSSFRLNVSMFRLSVPCFILIQSARISLYSLMVVTSSSMYWYFSFFILASSIYPFSVNLCTSFRIRSI